MGRHSTGVYSLVIPLSIELIFQGIEYEDKDCRKMMGIKKLKKKKIRNFVLPRHLFNFEKSKTMSKKMTYFLS